VVEAVKEMSNVTVAPGAAEPDDKAREISCPWQFAVPTTAKTKARGAALSLTKDDYSTHAGTFLLRVYPTSAVNWSRGILDRDVEPTEYLPRPGTG
jgi:hypothetical protein